MWKSVMNYDVEDILTFVHAGNQFRLSLIYLCADRRDKMFFNLDFFQDVVFEDVQDILLRNLIEWPIKHCRCSQFVCFCASDTEFHTIILIVLVTVIQFETSPITYIQQNVMWNDLLRVFCEIRLRVAVYTVDPAVRLSTNVQDVQVRRCHRLIILTIWNFFCNRRYQITTISNNVRDDFWNTWAEDDWSQLVPDVSVADPPWTRSLRLNWSGTEKWSRIGNICPIEMDKRSNRFGKLSRS